MITTNINTTPPNYEEEINSFYLTQLDRTYDEGEVLTKSSSIGCRPLAFAIKAGTKILINGISLEVYSDAAQSAVEFFITATTLTQSLDKGAKITIDKENLFLQYQRKTEGQVAGFDIDADGISKGGVEITGWLDSDTMEGATANNIPTAESVKAYVDASSGGTTPTLQEVTDTGNTTTNSVMIGSSSTPSKRLDIRTNGVGDGVRLATSTNLYFAQIINGNSETFPYGIINLSYGATTPVRISALSNELQISGGYTTGGKISFRTASTERMRLTDTGLGIGTTAPSEKLEVAGKAIIRKSGTATPHGDTDLLVTDSTASLSTAAVQILGGNAGFSNLHFSDTDSYSQGAIKYGHADNYMAFNSNASEKMRITSAGNVGIGTSTPNRKIHVVSSEYVVGDFVRSSGTNAYLSFQDSTTSGSGFVGVGAAGNNLLFRAGNVEHMRLTNTGLGIGTTSPGSLLHLESASPKIKFTDTTTNASSYIDADSGYGSISIMADHSNTASNSQINLMVDGTSKMVVKDTGKVGIGTTAPTEKLHVVGDALITGGLEVNAANIDFRGLGTSDPGVVGRLWQDSGILKISEG